MGDTVMAKMPKYYLVEATALPEVFLKVAEAKRMLETGEAATVNEATKATGISRSAFYKYRDSLMPFQNLMAGRIITFQLMLKDRTGVLAGILSIFSYYGANILTINQNIPSNGCAMLTISAETSELLCPVEELLKKTGNLDGVIKSEIVAG
jgi:chorismate mutase